MKFESVIFDMDGVIINSEIFYLERRKNFLLESGFPISHLNFDSLIGEDSRKILQEITNINDIGITRLQFCKNFEEYKKKNPVPYEKLVSSGVFPLLSFLKKRGAKIALASNSNKVDIMKALKATRLFAYFDVIFSGEDFVESKPNPEIYRNTMKELGTSQLNTLIIEDSTIGIRAGKAAGATVWALRNNQITINQKEADKCFDSLLDLKNYLENNYYVGLG